MVADPTKVPLIEQIQSHTLRVLGEAQIVPGVMAPNCYNFLHHSNPRDTIKTFLLQALEEKGYGGSTVIWSPNIPSGRTLALTGEIHAAVLSRNGLGWRMHEMKKELEEHALPMLPTFCYYVDSRRQLRERFCAFLDKFLPQP